MDEQLITVISGSVAAGITISFYACYIGYKLINLISDQIDYILNKKRKVESEWLLQ